MDIEGAMRVLEGFKIPPQYRPPTEKALVTVARYVLGKMGQSRKEPGERASYYINACRKYVGERIYSERHGFGKVEYLIVRSIGSRLAARGGPDLTSGPIEQGYVGPFAAYVRFDSGKKYLISVYQLKIQLPPTTAKY